ncbi:hypothetical protein EST38_g3064 [Candolleomyces aberdarensis]|uniref:Uncharacterized protein n=1 Tax=Candolleomyces aberdarensis TaxID=2316362 RepID=A0A4Q2DT02_9AGAR|nr:hypothetical protein EST38_g3064 [Candolleomyces aberdarensis]
MTLSITNVGVAQVTVPPVDSTSSTSTPPPVTNVRRQATPATVEMVINTKVNPDSLTFRWPSVNVTSGTYQLRASIASQNFVSRSDSFNIRQGPDTSCLQSGSTAPTMGTPSNTGINAPSPVSTTSKSINTGAIIGIVLGVLALLIAVFLAYLRIRVKGKKRFGFSKDGGSRKWNGLSSVDSRNALNNHDLNPPLASAKRRNYSRGSSLGTVVASHSKEAIGGGVSEEKVGSTNYSRKNSIASYDDSHVMALSTLPTLHHRDRDDVYSPRHQDPYPPAAVASVGRRASVDRKSARSRSQPYLDPIESDTNTVSRTSSIGGTSFTHTNGGPSEFYPPSHPSSPTPPLDAEAKKARRQSSGRKRKPVPAYDPNDQIPSLPSPTPQSPAPVDYEFGYDVRSSPSHQSHATTPDMTAHSPAHTSNTLGHYTTRNNAGAAEDGSETLGHKSSFGPAGVEGKPLHYLMPDLPMSAQVGSASSHSQR